MDNDLNKNANDANNSDATSDSQAAALQEPVIAETPNVETDEKPVEGASEASVNVAIVGCAHGEIEKIYDTVKETEEKSGSKIDLLICCGDFQATRNESDLRCMSVPAKYYNMGTFYKYYSGERKAPVLTLFIGGNHEASNYLQELPYGGWVAPNIYYVGYAGVVNVCGLRIGGISGIYKPADYLKGHLECAPYDERCRKSVYHVRNVEVFRMKQLSGPIDIIFSHDWPRGMHKYGSVDELLTNKPFFQKDIASNVLGSAPNEEILFHLKPRYWFAAHLHTRFEALIKHPVDEESTALNTGDTFTKFLALDKCLPRRSFFEVLNIPVRDKSLSKELSYDLEWLAILHHTDHLMSSKKTNQYMPGPNSYERWLFTPTSEEKEFVMKKFRGDVKVPMNFEETAVCYVANNEHSDSSSVQNYNHIRQPKAEMNPQTAWFCETLGVKDPIKDLLTQGGRYSTSSSPYSKGSVSGGDLSNSSSPSSFQQRYNNSTGGGGNPAPPKKVFPDTNSPKPRLGFLDENSENKAAAVAGPGVEEEEEGANKNDAAPDTTTSSTGEGGMEPLNDVAKTKMVLPAPKRKQEELKDTEGDGGNGEKINDDGDDGEGEVKDECKDDGEPSPKKFIRRNQSIYGEESAT